MSRGFAEEHGLKQTPQSSDDIDKEFNVWHSIFLDHVDIHDRSGPKKGPNQYGPVLFVFRLDILLHLPADTRVHVTKKNPLRWRGNDLDSDRWFQSATELAKRIKFGDFDKMLVIDTPSEKLDLPDQCARIILDDPKRNVSSGENAYAHAENRLKEAAAVDRVKLRVERRNCPSDCVCIAEYATLTPQEIDFYFT